MIGLLASAIAAFGGRWWLSVAALHQRMPGPGLVAAVAVSTFANVALSALAGAWIAGQVAGPGMLLFLALAILAAAAALLWRARAMPDAALARGRGPVSASVLLAGAQFGDSAQFVILAVAAQTGSGTLAALGGIAGLMAAAMSATMAGTLRPRWISMARRSCGVLFLIIGAVMALSAMGRI